MSKIKLNDILQLSEDQVKKTKIRLMVQNEFYNFNPNKDADNQEKQDELNLQSLVHNKPKSISFDKGIIAIGFIKIQEDHWLMTGIVKVVKSNGLGEPAIAEYMDKKYIFRLVAKYHKKGQQGILKAKKFIDEFEVVELWDPDKKINDNSFPGYKNVLINYSDLKNKLKLSDEWRNSLSLRKGIYVISDKKTGKLYIGSAYGNKGLLGRWQTYINSGYDAKEVENGKYPNKGLRDVVKENGMDYVRENFQYAILETFTEDVSDEFIIARESWWKEVLLSRQFGYNRN